MNNLDAISSSVCKNPNFRPCGEVAADDQGEGGVGAFEFGAFAFELFDFSGDGGGFGVAFFGAGGQLRRHRVNQ